MQIIMNIVKITYPPFDNVCSYFVHWDGEIAILIDCVPGCYEKANKNVGNRISVKISKRKRDVSRNTTKQKIKDYE